MGGAGVFEEATLPTSWSFEGPEDKQPSVL